MTPADWGPTDQDLEKLSPLVEGRISIFLRRFIRLANNRADGVFELIRYCSVQHDTCSYKECDRAYRDHDACDEYGEENDLHEDFRHDS